MNVHWKTVKDVSILIEGFIIKMYDITPTRASHDKGYNCYGKVI